jgi:hypothetical protein
VGKGGGCFSRHISHVKGGGGGQETDDYSQSLQDYRSQPDPYTLILLNRVSNYFVTGDDEKIAVILCIPKDTLPPQTRAK